MSEQLKRETDTISKLGLPQVSGEVLSFLGAIGIVMSRRNQAVNAGGELFTYGAFRTATDKQVTHVTDEHHNRLSYGTAVTGTPTLSCHGGPDVHLDSALAQKLLAESDLQFFNPESKKARVEDSFLETQCHALAHPRRHHREAGR